MSERRQITYYAPRIQIPVETMVDELGNYGWYCLPKDGAEAIIRILPYLRREVTYIGEYLDDRFFYGPTRQELNDILDLIAETEAGLMSSCDLTNIEQYLSDISDSLAALTVCTCNTANTPTGDNYQAVIQGSTEYSPDNATEQSVREETAPTVDSEKCDLANAIWGSGYQNITETVNPFLNQLVDSTATAIAATSTFAFLTGGLGLPVAIATALFSAVVAYVADGETVDYENWLVGNAQEMVCALYAGMVLDGFDGAKSAVEAYVDSDGVLSAGEKKITKAFFANRWVYQAIKRQVDTGSMDISDYLDYSCDDCIPEPDPDHTFDGTPCPNEDMQRTDYCQNDRSLAAGGQQVWTNNFTVSVASTVRIVVYGVGAGSSDPDNAITCQLYNNETADGSRVDTLTWGNGQWAERETTFSAVASNQWSVRLVGQGTFKQCEVEWVKVYIVPT